MEFKLPPLPYHKSALEPHISSQTLDFHYEKHHRGYMRKLEKALAGKPEAKRSLEDIILSAEGDVFNNAAQVWNHNFYWKCMAPDGGGKPTGGLADALRAQIGSYAEVKQRFAEVANDEFGSGWGWLVLAPGGHLRILSKTDAENPLLDNCVPLMTIDVWEHAYYLDYRNERDRYVKAFIDHLINWRFAEQNFEMALKSQAA